MCRSIYTDSIQTAADRAAIGAEEFARLMQSNRLGMEYRSHVRAQVTKETATAKKKAKGQTTLSSMVSIGGGGGGGGGGVDSITQRTIVCGGETIVVAQTDQIIDNPYKEMVNSTLDNVRALYTQLGRHLTPEASGSDINDSTFGFVLFG